MGYVLWGHRGSGDHGWEDWVRGVCKLLPEKPEVFSRHPEEDWRYGIGKLGGLFREQWELAREIIRPGDWLIGRDPARLDRFPVPQIRPVLWGWSPDRLTAGVLRRLSRFQAVVVTEERSYRRLRRAGLGENLHLAPEPAFLVDSCTSTNPLPEKTVGLSLSDPPEADRVLWDSYCHLIRWLLEETDWTVALIPYCVQSEKNDLPLHRMLYRQFRESGRILLREDGDCRVLRGELSQCRCCVGFSAAVAAWGCGVPALCLAGDGHTFALSQDLFGKGEEGVLPWQGLKTEEELTLRFRHFLHRQEQHRDQLEQKLPRLRHRTSVSPG